MKKIAKSIIDGEAVYVFEDPETAQRFLSSLDSPLYSNFQGDLLKLTNIRNVVITVRFEADVENLGPLKTSKAS